MFGSDGEVHAAPRRILLSVSPRMFSDALECLLTASGMEIVVDLRDAHPCSATGAEFFAAAIVTRPRTARAGLVIELSETDGQWAVVRTQDGDDLIDLRDIADVITLLDTLSR